MSRTDRRRSAERRSGAGGILATLGLAALCACGGASSDGGVFDDPFESEAIDGRGCVEASFSQPPDDLGLDPPPNEVRPGDGPLPDCPEEP